MTDTTFVDQSTVIEADWLNDVNDHVYSSTPVSPATTVHPASAIANTPAGTVEATTVQAAIDELSTDIENHIADTDAAHAASAIANAPSGSIAATNVQEAINELDTEKAGISTVALFPTITSATTTDIFGAAGATISIDNSTPVTTTDFTDCTAAQVGSVKRVIPVEDWTVTASANLTVDGATSGDFVMPAGVMMEVLATTTSTFKLTRRNVKSAIELHTANGYGSTNTKIRRFTSVVQNGGSDITYSDSAANGASFTIKTAGVYAISYSDQFSAPSSFGISRNSNQLTTGIASITNSNLVIGRTEATQNVISVVSATVLLAVGDVIRAHADGVSSGTQVWGERFIIAKV